MLSTSITDADRSASKPLERTRVRWLLRPLSDDPGTSEQRGTVVSAEPT
jgi:hypothetical protein